MCLVKRCSTVTGKHIKGSLAWNKKKQWGWETMQNYDEQKQTKFLLFCYKRELQRLQKQTRREHESRMEVESRWGHRFTCLLWNNRAETTTQWNKVFVQRRGYEWNLMEEWVMKGKKSAVVICKNKWNSAPTWLLWHDHPGVWIRLPPMTDYTFGKRKRHFYTLYRFPIEGFYF